MLRILSRSTPLWRTIASHDVSLHSLHKLIKAFCVFCDKPLIVPVAFDDVFGNSGQQSQIASDMRLHVLAGDLSTEQQTANIAGNSKSLQPQFSHRIDDDDATTPATNLHQRSHESRVI